MKNVCSFEEQLEELNKAWKEFGISVKDCADGIISSFNNLEKRLKTLFNQIENYGKPINYNFLEKHKLEFDETDQTKLDWFIHLCKYNLLIECVEDLSDD